MLSWVGLANLTCVSYTVTQHAAYSSMSPIMSIRMMGGVRRDESRHGMLIQIIDELTRSSL